MYSVKRNVWLTESKALAKMRSFGLGDLAVSWIEASRSGRVCMVHVGGEHSGAIPMHSGVPQDSVIGPLRFLLFVNGLPDVLEALTLLLADDIKMVTRRSQSMNLHSSLTAAWDWSQKWDLPINPTKSNLYLTIGREVSLSLSFFPNWSGTPIPVSKSVKDLKVQTDDMFSSFVQCTEATNKDRRLIFTIRHSFRDLSKSAFIPLYGALVRPHLKYGMLALIPCSGDDIGMASLPPSRYSRAFWISIRTCFSFLPLDVAQEGTPSRYSKMRATTEGNGRHFR